MFILSQINCLYCNNKITVNRTVKRYRINLGIVSYTHNSKQINDTKIRCKFCQNIYILHRAVNLNAFECVYAKIFIETCKRYGIQIGNLKFTGEIAEPINGLIKRIRRIFRKDERRIDIFFLYQGRKGYITAKLIADQRRIELRHLWLER